MYYLDYKFHSVNFLSSSSMLLFSDRTGASFNSRGSDSWGTVLGDDTIKIYKYYLNEHNEEISCLFGRFCSLW